MHPILLIGGQTRDGTSHTYGMSVCRTAILHHQDVNQKRHPSPDGVFDCRVKSWCRASFLPVKNESGATEQEVPYEHGTGTLADKNLATAEYRKALAIGVGIARDSLKAMGLAPYY